MTFLTLLLQSLLVVPVLFKLAIAGYTLEDDYNSSNFFSEFSFFTDTDPTNGFVDYVSQSTAQSSGLINTSNNQVYLGVDSTNVTPNGRPSVRLTSNKSYNQSLVIADIAHMPGGICGTWPAFWMVGPNWPDAGEIDIIEGVNQQDQNDMTLHTSDGCTISNNGDYTGTMSTSNCYVDAPGQSANSGCQIADSSTESYGTGFNSIGGGVYATLLTSDYVQIWFFTRGSIPSDITSGAPNPSGWGEPLAYFSGDCDFAEHFYDQSLVFDTTFCGDWAGNVWSSGSCASQASTCDSFVENNPSAFVDAYWLVNSIKVYTNSSSSYSDVESAPSSSSNTPVSTNIPVSSSAVAVTSTVIATTTYGTPNPFASSGVIPTGSLGTSLSPSNSTLYNATALGNGTLCRATNTTLAHLNGTLVQTNLTLCEVPSASTGGVSPTESTEVERPTGLLTYGDFQERKRRWDARHLMSHKKRHGLWQA